MTFKEEKIFINSLAKKIHQIKKIDSQNVTNQMDDF